MSVYTAQSGLKSAGSHDQPMGDTTLSAEISLTDITSLNSHPSDSSRMLLGLMALSRKASLASSPENHLLEGVIDAGVLRSLLGALNFRDPSTVRHARRTASLAMSLGRHLGWDGRDLRVLEIAALLHDIGKIGVPDSILYKPTILSPDEAELMSLHYSIGVDVLQACRVDQQVLDYIGHTQQRFDTSRDGRSPGGEIPIGARILAIADAYDSLRTHQVYRSGKSHENVMEVLIKNSGTQFDGNVVAALSRFCQLQGIPDYPVDPTSHDEKACPLNPKEGLEASTLCHIFNHLYLLESLYDGFYLVDTDMRVVVWNRGMENLLGYSAKDVLSKVWSDRELHFLDLDNKPLAEDQMPINRVLSSGRTISTSLRAMQADGAYRDVELQTVPLMDTEHHLYGVAQIARDLNRSGRKPQEFRELRLAATRDALTLVANRGELETQLALAVKNQSGKEDAEPFSIIFVDADHFKSINDTFGHTVGDKVLIELARLMQQEMYSGELVARYGGEEFVIVCPETDLQTAVNRAERLRMAISKLNIPEMNGRKLTSSLGVSQFEPGDSVESVLKRADEALYISKKSGRNQTNSLTPTQLDSSPGGESDELKVDPFQFQAGFQAVITSDMIVYKLGGFVTENRARLLKVTKELVRLQLGYLGLFRYWGKEDESRPVIVEVHLGKPDDRAISHSVSIKVEIKVEIKPVGWIRSPEVFQLRAKQVFKSLKSYFAAEV